MKSRVVQLRASPATFDGLMDADRELAQNREPDLVLAFLAPDGNADDTLGAMAEVWPSSCRIGCESAHQFANAEITTCGCLHCFWFDDAKHGVHVEVLTGDHDNPPETALIDRACASLAGCDAAFLLADGLHFPTPLLLRELRRNRASLPTPIVGALASRSELEDNRLDQTGGRVFFNAQVYSSACLVIGFRGFEVKAEVVRDFNPASPVYTVHRAEGSRVYEIDGESAVDWYRRFFMVDGHLAPMPHTAHSFPLMIAGPDPTRRNLCRTMRAFDDPEGTVTFWGDVRDGEQVRLGLSQELSLVRTAKRLGENLEDNQDGNHRSEAALLCTFAGREILLGDNAETELHELHEALGGIALAGSFTLGEIGPGESGGLVVHNQTALLMLLREKVR